MISGYPAFLGWTREEWLIAARWALAEGKEYAPTLADGQRLQNDWLVAHTVPEPPEERWFRRFKGEVMKAVVL